MILNDEGDYAQYIGRAFYYYTITNEDGSIRYVTQKDYDSQLAGTWTGGLIQKNRGLVQINIAPERLKTVAGTATLEYVVSHMNVYGSGKVIIFDTSENHQCIYSNNDLDLNLSASALGFSSDAFDETGATYSGTTTLNGNEYFQILKYSGGRYTGVLVPTDDVYAKRTYVSLTIFISSLIGIMVLMIVNCLFGAKEEALYLEGKQNAEKRSRNEKETITVTLPSGKTKKTRSAAARWDAPAVAWRDKSPDQKLATITTLLVYVFITITVLGILFARIGLFDIKLVNYTYSVVAKRGLNIFTLTQGIIILLIVFYIAKIVQLLIQVTAENVGSRAETLGHLLASVIRYGVVIWAIFYILYLCGLDTGSLLASAGILSLVIGLGAQSMIQDILAGLFIVF